MIPFKLHGDEAIVMQLIRNNLAYKLIAVLMGISIWVYVLYQEIETDIRTRPIKIENEPKGYVVTACRPQEVEVTLRGHKRVMESLRERGVVVIADLSQVDIHGPDDYSVRLRLSEVPVGIGSHWEISPTTAKVTLEPIESRERRVVAELLGMPDEKHRVVTPAVVEPQTVKVEGARSIVHEVQKVVATVDVTGLADDQTFDVQPQALGRGDLKLAGVKITPSIVKVTVRVRPVEFRVVPIRLNLSGSLAPGYRIVSVDMNPLVVTVKGDTSSPNFARLESVDTDPIDISGRTTTVRRSVALRVPQGVSVLSTRFCRVTVEIAPESPSVVPVPAEEAAASRPGPTGPAPETGTGNSTKPQ